MVKKQWQKFMGRGNIGQIVEISLDEIVQCPYKYRNSCNDLELRELARSIQTYGVIQPIIVRYTNNGYELIAGGRRIQACKMLGNKTIPAIIQEMDDEKAAAISLIENLQYKELNYFEEASAYRILLNDFDMTKDELAQKIGKSPSTIRSKLHFLRLPEEIRELILADVITEQQAQKLFKLNSIDMQKEVIKQIYEQDLNVRETDELVEKLSHRSISTEVKKSAGSVSMVIRDARIFMNTIRETVKRARKTGIDMVMVEAETNEIYEVLIKVPKVHQGISDASGE